LIKETRMIFIKVVLRFADIMDDEALHGKLLKHDWSPWRTVIIRTDKRLQVSQCYNCYKARWKKLKPRSINMEIINVDAALYRGPAPDNADETINTNDWAQLKSIGILTVLDLQTNVGIDGDLLREQQHGNLYGIRVYNHPLGFLLPPTVDEVIQALKVIKLEIAAGKSVYVHCRDGIDRTGIIIAAYRIKVQNWPIQQAIDEMYATGFHWYYFYWINVLREI
jgi:hypothetical protein